LVVIEPIELIRTWSGPHTAFTGMSTSQQGITP
jgi:hypothetical protein